MSRHCSSQLPTDPFAMTRNSSAPQRNRALPSGKRLFNWWARARRSLSPNNAPYWLLTASVDHALVDIVAAQVRVAVGRFHFHHAFAHFEDRNVERAAAEIVNRDGFVLLLVQPVSQRRRRRLIDDAHHFQTGNLAGVLGGSEI